MNVRMLLIASLIAGLTAGCPDTTETPPPPTDTVQSTDVVDDEGIVDNEVDQDTDQDQVEISECDTDEECVELLGAIDQCQEAKCVESPTSAEIRTCEALPAPDFRLCDDGNACTEETVCLSGECAGGLEIDCTDDDQCTADTCLPATGCSNPPDDGAACDDGNQCTENDSCLEKQCNGTPVASDECGCLSDADCPATEDLCAGKLVCLDSWCQLDPDSVVKCDDSQDTDCEKSECQPGTGQCEPAPKSGNNCSDGNPCTTGEACDNGECTGGTTVCDCTQDSDCEPWEDGNLCNGTLACNAGSCVVDQSTIIACEQDDNTCSVATCQPADGSCKTDKLKAGTSCNDGNACTAFDFCSGGGECIGEKIGCNDKNVCTDDTCDPGTGCVYTSTLGACDDGDECTDTDTCNADGACVGSGITCDDSNECTEDSCDPTSGCVYTPTAAACDDGNACTDVDTCVDGTCAGTPIVCDDLLDCTDNSCDPELGCIVFNNTNSCDDGDPCTLDDVCAQGLCAGTPNTCDDGNVCTDDSCAPGVGCENTDNTLDCDDEDACTQSDVCADGICAGEAIKDCLPNCGDNLCDDGDGEHCSNCPQDCGVCDGDCCESNGTTGCQDETVTQCVCDLDSYCCDTDWDDLCVGTAVDECALDCVACGDSQCTGDETCVTCQQDCGSCLGDCCEDNGTLGCSDDDVTACVCAIDDFCCTNTWDGVCTGIASAECGATCNVPGPDINCGDNVCGGDEHCGNCAQDCGACEGSCCSPNGSPGCDQPLVTTMVCSVDSYCCDTAWDNTCVAAAADLDAYCPVCGDGICDPDASENCATCQADCGSCVGDCCDANGTVGCVDDAVTACVCAIDDFCCNNEWDGLCVGEAVSECGQQCVICGDGQCQGDETLASCPTDCSVCGDGECTGDENCGLCPGDCGTCEGSCCEDNGTPGCDQPDVAEQICGTDPFCCDTAWDSQCATSALLTGAYCPECGDDICDADAAENCSTCAADCGACAGDCCADNGSAGCVDPDVTACVCAIDDFCCNNAWDGVCTGLAGGECGVACDVPPPALDCGNNVCDLDETCSSCAADCGACTGVCCEGNGTPGCDQSDVTEGVCGQDSYCCTVEWDNVCAAAAVEWGTECPICGDDVCSGDENCSNCWTDCGACEGSCCEDNGTIGCVDPNVMTCTCDIDSTCCTGSWTAACAKIGLEQCNAGGSCTLPGESCCGPNGSVGCEAQDIQGCVCSQKSECCTGSWDASCVALARGCGACQGDCCDINPGGGCGDDSVNSCVCDVMPGCCSGEWGEDCIEAAFANCGAVCEAPAPDIDCGNGVCGGDETCASCPADCGACDGGCCVQGDTPGCNQGDVASCVCANDSYCCEVAWDELCVTAAREECGACQDDCCDLNGTGGCEDTKVNDCVCGIDESCCDGAWDEDCIEIADAMCGAACPAPPQDINCGDNVCAGDETCSSCAADCGACTGGCCAANDTGGCVDDDIAACVCAQDSYCCDTEWDELCVTAARDECGACQGDCCEINAGGGCKDVTVQNCTCDIMPGCCSGEWGEDCVEVAFAQCSAVCEVPPLALDCGNDVCGGDETCSNCPADCGACAGDCCAENGSAGCSDNTVTACVCANDSYCCDTDWDNNCVAAATEDCSLVCP